jgi:beta-mannosidase
MGPVIPPSERRLDSPSMLQHQKSGGGNQKIARAVEEWLGRPCDFESLIYLSQVYQAMAIRTGVEHWRRNAPRTMGALYWQANDCWPVMSWASLDYFGRWKALHYAARRFFAPYLVSGLAEEAGVHLWATAGFETAPAAGELRWQVRSYDGRRLADGRQAFGLEPGKTFGPVELAWSDIPGAKPDAAYVAAELAVGGAAVARRLVLGGPAARAPLPGPKIKAAVRREGESAVVDVSAENLAVAVCLEAPGLAGRFEDNFFNLLPGERRSVRLLAAARVQADDLAARLRVRTLYDSRSA